MPGICAAVQIARASCASFLLPDTKGRTALARKQPGIVAELPKPARPVMRAAAGFHRDHARREIGEVLEELRPLYGRLPGRKDRFRCDGQADCSSVSGLSVQRLWLLALMVSADPRLIHSVGFSPSDTMQAWRIAVRPVCHHSFSCLAQPFSGHLLCRFVVPSVSRA